MTGLSRALLVVAVSILASGCVLHVKELNPSPNVAHGISAPKEKLTLKLGDSIRDKFSIELQGGTVEFDTFRDDLKRAFGNGFGSFFDLSGDPELVLEISNAEPSFQCFPYVGCKAMLKFRGVVANGRTRETTPFAGRVGSEVYNGQDAFTTATKEVIERMYEEISTMLGGTKPLGGPPPNEKSTSL